MTRDYFTWIWTAIAIGLIVLGGVALWGVFTASPGADTVDRVHGGTAQAWYRVAIKQTHNANRLSDLNHKLLKLNRKLLDVGQ